MTTTIVALYESMGDAGQVRRELEAIGIPSSDINISNQQGQHVAGSRSTVTETHERESGGFLDWLFGVPDEHVSAYREGVERGNTLVTVRAPEAQIDRVSAILERYEPIDIEQRGARAAATGAGTAAGASAARAATSGRSTEEAHIPVVEEEIQVGKRAVERGGVRVRSYVVERPVEEEVRLRDESVHVERRPVTSAKPVTDDAFKERSFEVTERDEEAVVAKTARVKEEVVVRKDVGERVERVKDTVRRTDVEVEPAVETTGAGPSDRRR